MLRANKTQTSPQKVELAGQTRSGDRQQNPYAERFNSTMRDELLNGEEFDTVLETRVLMDGWNAEYNTVRPHRGLGMLSPAVCDMG